MVGMRWDAQKLDLEEPAAPPGLPTVRGLLRRVQVPEFPGLTFHEVRAKSALNAVPAESAMPFGHTINPYRGCSHACVYCLGGDTGILMADGRTKPLEEVRPGDEIYGTARERFYRRYVTTTVRAHWSTVKPAYRVVLQEGTELITSGDHRFLTVRGWKHVTDSEPDRRVRAHLTVNDRMMGVGAFSPGPEDSPGYRRGFVCGMVRGDDRLLADPAAWGRLLDYLREPAEALERLELTMVGGPGARSWRDDAPIEDDDPVGEMTKWPRAAGEDWCKG